MAKLKDKKKPEVVAIKKVEGLLNSFGRNEQAIEEFLLSAKNGKVKTEYILPMVIADELSEKISARKLVVNWTKKASAVGVDILIEKNKLIFK